MAVIKIINIKENLETVINCAQNGDKTENGILVSEINCVPKEAYKQMALAKKNFHKESVDLDIILFNHSMAESLHHRKQMKLKLHLQKNYLEINSK